MKPQQLKYFVAIAEHSSLTAAASSLHVSAASISEQIRVLEVSLGVTLFDRTRRELRLTTVGRQFLPHARSVLAEIEVAQRAATALSGLEHGELEVGLFRNGDYCMGPELISALRRAHPRLRLRVVGHNAANVAKLVRKGRLEVGFVVLPIDDHGLTVTPLARDENVYLTADADRAADPVTIADLASRQIVLYDAQYGLDDPTRRQLSSAAQLAGHSISPVIEVERIELALQIVRAGLADTIGWGTLAAIGPAQGLHVGRLSQPIHDVIAVVTPKGVALSPGAKAVIAAARRCLAELTLTIPTLTPLSGLQRVAEGDR